MLTAKEQAARRKYIGGSDAAAVLGCSRWSTPLEVWAIKTGQIEKEDEPTLQKILGSRLEEVVAEMFTADTGLKVQRKKQTIFHKRHPFIGANIDRAIIGRREGLECKTASGWKAKEWEGEEIPQEYIIQCHHYLAATGWDRWHLACLIGNEKFVKRTIERDEQLLKAMVEKERVFWQEFVERGIMPAHITSADSDTLYQLFPQAEPTTLDLGDEIAAMVELRNASLQDKKVVEANIDKLENQIKAVLGKAEAGRAGKYLVTWKNQSQSRLDQDALKLAHPDLVEKYRKVTEFRQFRAREVKNGNG